MHSHSLWSSVSVVIQQLLPRRNVLQNKLLARVKKSQGEMEWGLVEGNIRPCGDQAASTHAVQSKRTRVARSMMACSPLGTVLAATASRLGFAALWLIL